MKKTLLAISMLFTATVSNAQDRFANVEVKAQAVSGSVYMLTGSGGNIGLSVGDDGVLMIDDQYAPLAEKISAAIAQLTDAKTRFIVNTHYHGDHTGSNAFFAEQQGATIFAHENVRVRLASSDDVEPAALPVVSYQEGLKFHINGETVHVFHLAPAHTDGDSAIWFEQANVLHTGDLFFRDMFPYIDLGAGGNVQGYIQSVEVLLSKIDEQTKIIPGHGPLAQKDDLKRFVDMIKETYHYVQSKKSQGMSEAQVLEGGLEAKWDNWSWRFINTERWIKTLYQ